MIPIYDFDQVSPEEIFSRETDRADVSGAVAAIIADVRQNGDSALLRYARDFDHAELTAVEVPREAMEAAARGLDSGLRAVLEEAAANYEFVDYAFLDSDLLGDVRRVEGYLYPDTYQFYVGRSAVAALDSMLSNFNSRVYSNGELTPLFEEAAARGYDFSDIITIASLIEEETDGTDRDKIASVIYNRLERPGETGGLLQIDAALVYAAGRAITQEDYTTLDSPYNLYQHTGLPPTAISNPGMSSITAALQPAETDYYYYVLGADGKHVFSETLSEHQQNVAAASAASGD